MPSQNPVCPESTIESANRRKFIKKAMFVTAGAGIGSTLLARIPESNASSSSSCKSSLIARPAESDSTFCCLTVNDNTLLKGSLTVNGRTVTCNDLRVIGGAIICGPLDVYDGFYSSSDNNCAVLGFSPSHAGVVGKSSCSYGVMGFSCNSVGVKGCSPKNVGVLGRSCCSYGVEGFAVNCTGVYGQSGSGIGVQGSSCTSYGVLGYSGESIGVFAQSGSSGAIPIVAQGAFCQTANLQQWENRCGQNLSVVNKCGWFGVGTGSSPTTLTVGGSVSARTVTTTANYKMGSSDFAVLASGKIKVTLPPASTANGMIVFVKNISTSTVTIDAFKSSKETDTIEGAAAQALKKQYDSLQLISNGSNEWFIVGSVKCGAVVS